MNDLISRQAAIDALRMDISIIPFSKAREYVHAAIETIYNRLEELPSAQPEIIRCEDCGLYYYAYNRVSEEREWTCAVSGEHRSKDDFCSRAIPKEEEDG